MRDLDRQHDRDDELRETPPAAIAAVTFGTVPLPFLAVYATLFILHGWIRPVHPPDITDSQQGELIAGIITAAVFVVLSVTVWMFVGGRRRWPFAVGQFAVVVGTGWVVADTTRGGTVVAAIVLVTSLLALVLAYAPGSWEHVGHLVPGIVRTVYPGSGDTQPPGPPGPLGPPTGSVGDPVSLPGSTEPDLVEPAALRRRPAPTQRST